MRRIIILLGIATLMAPAAATAQEAANGQPGSFLRFGASARSLAMGGAAAGLADDAGALYYNPAGLEQVRSTELLFFHAELLEGTRYQFLGVVQPMGAVGTLGVGGILLSSGGYERSTLFEDLGETFDESQSALQVSLAKRIGLVSAAVTYRSVNHRVAGYSGSGRGLDFALFSRPSRALSYGVNLQNVMAPMLRLERSLEYYPVTVRAGAGLHLSGGRFHSAVDLVRVGDNPVGVYAGFEYWGVPSLALRSGWDTVRNGYTGGLGYRRGAWQMDYAASDSPLGISHRLSFTWRFGVPHGVTLKANAARFSPTGERDKVELQLKSQFRGKARGWELVIFDQDGEARHSASGSKEPPEVYSWNGTDDRGRLVATGSYRVVVVVFDEFDDPWTQETTVEIRDYDPELKTPVRMDVN